MKIKGVILFALCVLFSQATLAAKVYKCKNAQGGISYQDSTCGQANQPVSTWNSTKSNPRTLTLKAGDAGHYTVDGQVNGQTVVFVVDTGASFVAIPQAMAGAAHLSCQNPATSETANGTTSGCTASIGVLNFGSFTLREVTAVLLPNLAQPLLGMNVLKQFNITQENGEMRLTAK